MIEQNKTIMGFNLIWLYNRVDLMHEVLADVAKLDLGKPHVGHEFSFDHLVDAIKLFQTGKTIEKVVVKV